MTHKEYVERKNKALMDLVKWTIENVEHGVYVPIIPPETDRAIDQLVLDVIGEPETADHKPHDDVRNGLKVAQRQIVEGGDD